MTMHSPQHPDDELLAAFADGEESGPAAHVRACDRCTALVGDLRMLRTSLATLPDVAPPRPLRFLPPVEASAAPGGFAVLVRRLFAPAMVAGAALVLVGSVGMAASPGGPATSLNAGEAAGRGGEAPDGANQESQTYNVDSASQGGGRTAMGSETSAPEVAGAPTPSEDTTPASQAPRPFAAATPWLPVTIVGAIVLIVTMILRWTVVPRAPDPPLYPGA
jgi:hypothetical protein